MVDLLFQQCSMLFKIGLEKAGFAFGDVSGDELVEVEKHGVLFHRETRRVTEEHRDSVILCAFSVVLRVIT